MSATSRNEKEEHHISLYLPPVPTVSQPFFLGSGFLPLSFPLKLFLTTKEGRIKMIRTFLDQSPVPAIKQLIYATKRAIELESKRKLSIWTCFLCCHQGQQGPTEQRLHRRSIPEITVRPHEVPSWNHKRNTENTTFFGRYGVNDNNSEGSSDSDYDIPPLEGDDDDAEVCSQFEADVVDYEDDLPPLEGDDDDDDEAPPLITLEPFRSETLNHPFLRQYYIPQVDFLPQ